MAPCVEILFVPATEAYRNDPSVLNATLDIVNECKGSLGVYHGFTIEDPDQLLVVIVWESLEAHKALIDDKVLYPKLVTVLGQATDLSKVDMFHVYFAPEDKLAAVLNTTYISYAHMMSLKPGKTAGDIEAQLKAMSELPPGEGSPGGVWGNAVEKDERVMIYGWDDPKYHHAIMTRPESAQILGQMKETVEKHKWGHVKFNVYKKYEA